jgi:carboxylesterase
VPEAPVRPGAEPLSHDGDRRGVLVLHGFTGNPGSMRPVAQALVAAGFSVEMPRLPGHGTSVDDMLTTGWADWSGEAQGALDRLRERTDAQAVVGLSMGGTLTAWIAAHNEVAGAVFINALVRNADPGLRQLLEDMIAAGEAVAPGVGSDIADPGATEDAYDGSPLVPLMTLFDAVEQLQPKLADINCPVLVMTSPEDHVVEPANSDHLAEHVGGPVERVALARSYHVATLDYDREEIQRRVVEFCSKVLGA